MGLERPRLIDVKDLTLTASFECQSDALTGWLRVHAWASHQGRSARVYVLIDTTANLIAGYYCLSASSVEHAKAPARVGKGLAQYPIPVVLIGRLAVDRRYEGQGLGRFLIRDAFHQVLRTDDTLGIRAVMVQAKNEALAAFYRKLGFETADSSSRLFFYMVKDIRKSLTGTGETFEFTRPLPPTAD